MDKIEKSGFFKRNGTFLILLSVGLFLRILFIDFQGLSNDELSAWYRTRFTMGEEFWKLGVSQGDMHPAFYQVFLWVWVRIFGDAEFSLRATSLMFFALNLLLLYQIGCRFFSKYAANIISAFYVSLGFLIVNTTTARPYNSGVFFLLLTFYLILLLREKKELFGWGRSALLLVAFFGAMTSHYFAFLSVGILGACGLFFVEKEGRKYLLLSGASALGFFMLLHFSITQEQLSQGGLGWLGKPPFYWFIDFSKQLFQNSYVMLLVGIGFILMAKYKSANISSNQRFSLAVMLAISVVAYLISLMYTPILRELVFQFILPFAFFGVLGMIQLEKGDSFMTKTKPYLPFVIILVFGLHSVFAYSVFEPVHYGVFKELAQNQREIESEFKGESIDYAQNTNNFDYLNYYLKKPKMIEPISDWASAETVYTLSERAKNSKADFYLYNWTNNYHVPMYLEVIKRHFPEVVRSQNFFNSGSYFFSKSKTKTSSKNRLLKRLSDEGVFKGDEYFLDINLSVGELRSLLQENEYLLLTADGKVYNADKFFLVAEARNSAGETIMKGDQFFWYRADDQQRLTPGHDTKSFFTAFALEESLDADDVIKIYCWNPEKDTILFNNLKLYAVK